MDYIYKQLIEIIRIKKEKEFKSKNQINYKF